VPDELLGQQVKCPTCGATFTADTGGTAPAKEPPRPEEARVTPSGRPRPAERHEGDRGGDEEYDDEPRRRRLMRRDMQSHRGTLVLILGIISLVTAVFMCCGLIHPVFGIPFVLIGLALGITSWVMGQGDLRKMDARVMDPEGRGATQGGWICGMIATILAGLGMLCTILLLVVVGAVGLGAVLSK
jgi:hypothetical protein